MRGYGYGPQRPGLHFSATEVRHLLLALGALILAFAIFLGRNVGLVGGFLLSAVAVPAGFLLHELGHKVVAQRYGCWAEFRAYLYGLLLAVLTAFLGILFAAPGAVMVSGRVTERENGHISAAGPLVNLGVGGAFLGIWLGLRQAGVDVLLVDVLTLQNLASSVALISLFLGTFNMVPFPPLDGSKVLRWSLGAYVALLLPLVVLLGLLLFRVL